MGTVCVSEFQTVGAEDWKARLEKSVLMNGLSSSGMAAERKDDTVKNQIEYIIIALRRFRCERRFRHAVQELSSLGHSTQKQ